MFKIGDRVVCKKIAVFDGDIEYFYNKSGIILQYHPIGCIVKFDERFTTHLHGEDNRCWHFYHNEFHERFYFENEKLNEERELKREENRLKYILVDPFGEEIW